MSFWPHVSLLLVGARDLRTLWSRVLQHHHHLQPFASRFGFLSNASKRKPETELLVWKHERVTTEKKRFWSWSAPIKISLLFSSVLLLFSRLQQRSTPPPGHAPLVLGTREWLCSYRPCWELENGRARTARAGNQRTAVPVSPVQGTREPAGLLWRTQPGTPRRARSVKIRECWVEPDRPFVTDPSSVTDRQEN